jgi:DNA-directed RNA polymerase subunit RPC12/RpoP
MNKKYKCDHCDKFFSSKQSKSNHNKIKHFEEIKKNKNTEFICIHCKKEFTTNFSLNRHLKSFCKIKNNTLNKIVNEKLIKNKVNITINNHIQNNILNNFHNNTFSINPINKPNISSFRLLDICDIFDKEFNMILKLIERTYFNSSIQENHVFYVSNLQGQYLNTYDKDDETTKIKKYFFDELFGISLDRIKTLYKTYKKKLFEIPKQKEIQEKIAALEEMRNENNHTYKSYLKLINVLAYDKKDLVLNTFNKLKQLENNDDIIWDRNIEI